MHEKRTVISVLVSQPAPEKAREEYCRPPLEEKVDEYIRRVESNVIDSEYEWKYLKTLYEKLIHKNHLTSEQERVIYKLEELIEKFAGHESEDPAQVDAQLMHRGSYEYGD